MTEILIVDDRLAPGPIELPGAPLVRVTAPDAHGPGPARQAGVEQAQGDIVLLLDDDVVPEPGLATGHAHHHAGTSGLVVVGSMPVEVGADAEEQWFSSLLYATDYQRWMAMALSDPEHVLSRLWGGNFSLRRTDALRVGLCNPRFSGRRHEDLEFGLRARAAGLTGRFDPLLAATHRYDTTEEAFLLDAYAQGEEWVQLRAAHPEADLEPPTARYTAGLPRGLRDLVLLARRHRGAAILRRTLRLSLAVARIGGADRLRLRLAKLARRVEQLDGARQAELRQCGAWPRSP